MVFIRENFIPKGGRIFEILAKIWSEIQPRWRNSPYDQTLLRFKSIKIDILFYEEYVDVGLHHETLHVHVPCMF